MNCHYPANIYLFKVYYRNTRKRCEMFKVTNTGTTVPSFINLNIFHNIFSSVFIVAYEQVNVYWVQAVLIEVSLFSDLRHIRT